MRTIGIDLGGTKLLAAVVDGAEAGRPVKRPTPTDGPRSVVAAMVEVVAELGGADQVGIGTPGVVDQATGRVSNAPNLRGFDGSVGLWSMLRDALPGTEVRLDNDVNVGLLGEQAQGAARGAPDALGVFVGTGVGGALILDGQLRRGPRGITGEIGHVGVEPGGRPCPCGRRGHLEGYAGRAGIEAEARRRYAAGERTALVDLAGDGPMKSGVIAKALAAGDPMAQALVASAVTALGLAIASALTLLDVPLVVLGGGLTEKLSEPFVSAVSDAVAQRLLAGTTVEMVPAALGDLSGVVGAASLFSA
jgi:glucokinase